MPNIFEFVGLPADHRKVKKIYQLVKQMGDVNPMADLGVFHKKVHWPMWGQEKKDGVFAAFVVNDQGEVAIFNRTGKLNTSTECLLATLDECELEPGVYCGEMLSTHPCSLEQLSGVVTPLRKKPLSTDSDGCNQVAIAACLYIDFFDHLTLDEFECGFSDAVYTDRHAYLNSLYPFQSKMLTLLPYVRIDDYDHAVRYAEAHINNGGEGAVFKQDVGYLCGAKDWHQMKIVRGMHVDLECLYVEEGKGKYRGLVANIFFRYKNGVELKAMPGKNWSHEDCRKLFDDFNAGNEDSPVGKIYHVYGMQPSSKNGLIRQPKVAERRDDKDIPDY